MKNIFAVFGFLFCIFQAKADYVDTTIPVGEYPYAIAVNCVTNKIYVTNRGNRAPNGALTVDGTVTVIDGATNVTTSIDILVKGPLGIVVDSVTNKVYTVDADSFHNGNYVTIINGMTNAITNTIGIGEYFANPMIAINPTTNKIYVVKDGDDVVVIDGATNATATISGTGSGPLAVNPLTNMIYSAQGINVIAINGATNVVTTIVKAPIINGSAGEIFGGPLVVNPVTNMTYLISSVPFEGTPDGMIDGILVINGATNVTSTLVLDVQAETCNYAMAINPVANEICITDYCTGIADVISQVSINPFQYPLLTPEPDAIVINPATNATYVTNEDSGTVAIIKGINGNYSYTTLPVGNNPTALAVNSVTDKIYVLNTATAPTESSTVTVINGTTPTSIVPKAIPASIFGYSGTVVVYSLNGRQVLKIPFVATETKEALIRNIKMHAGVYEYKLLNGGKTMEEGHFVIK